MHTPQSARHIVVKTTEQVASVQDKLNNDLRTLQTEHGKGSPKEYSPDVFTRHQSELRAAAIENLPGDIAGVLRGAETTLAHSADFDRVGVLRRSTVPAPGKASDDPAHREVMRLSANMELDRKERALGVATDEDLAGRYAEQAIRDNDLPLASLLLDESARRGGVTSMRVRKIIDGLELPEVDADTEHLEHLPGEVRDLEANLQYLRSGTKNTRYTMRETLARQERQRQQAG